MSSGEHALIWWVTVGGAYVILWWMTFFILLPIGMHSEDDPPSQFVLGEAPKPPSDKHKPTFSITKKLLFATGISAMLWLILYALVLWGIIQL